MAYYRLYFMAAGRIERFHEFEADDDSAAIAAAGRMSEHRTMELWSGGRKVYRWDGPPVRPLGTHPA